jgi:hypothetical protein
MVLHIFASLSFIFQLSEVLDPLLHSKAPSLLGCSCLVIHF